MRRFGPVLIAVLAYAGDARPCSVPVFRYALENWAPSKYELLYVHDSRAVDRPDPDALRARFKNANLTARLVDVAAEVDAATRKLVGTEPKPGLILRYPDAGEQIPAAWRGASGDRIATSPARRKLIDRLKSGYAGVVVLLLSGDKEQDAAARSFLADQLPRIAGRVELPKPSDEGPQIMWDAPVRVEFPVVEVERNTDEDVFVQILLGSEDGLRAVTGPIAFPVFGRGRALCSLHGRDLEKPSELLRSLEYLCKACSCQVKELNPGLDLLLATDWQTPVEPPDVERRSPPPAGYETVEVVTEDETPTRPSRYVLALAVAAVIVTGLWVLLSRRRPG
jgi:hypothetical protein